MESVPSQNVAGQRFGWGGAGRKERDDRRPELRVLQVFSVLGMGGAETWLMSLLKYFQEDRYSLPFRVRMDICLTGGKEALFDQEAKSLGARIFYIPYTRREVLRFTRGFRKILLNGQYDAIHDHQDYTSGWHFLFGWGCLPPVRIAHVHNPFFCVATHDGNLTRRLTLLSGKRLISSFATHITGTSREILGKYGFDDPTFEHVHIGAAHCGFDVSQYRGTYTQNHQDVCQEFGWNNSAKILLFVGRLNTTFGKNLNQKNPFFALEVAKCAIASDPNIHMLVAGGGEDVREALQDRVKRWRLETRIRLIGVRRDIPRLMAGSDLLLFPSLEEGLGMVAVEAQASGLRVLAADVVPHECVVLPTLVRFQSLDTTSADWANEALRILNSPKPDPLLCNRSVEDSAFSIENSARNLVALYSSNHTNA
jgi:glycosyltransferase EpsF